MSDGDAGLNANADRRYSDPHPNAHAGLTVSLPGKPSVAFCTERVEGSAFLRGSPRTLPAHLMKPPGRPAFASAF
jgi:hypothetical protein